MDLQGMHACSCKLCHLNNHRESVGGNLFFLTAANNIADIAKKAHKTTHLCARLPSAPAHAAHHHDLCHLADQVMCLQGSQLAAARTPAVIQPVSQSVSQSA